MISKPALSLLMLLSFCRLAEAAVLLGPDPNAGASKSYSHLLSLRAEAQKLSAKDAGEEDLRRAVTRYDDALRYLSMRAVSERAVGDARLESEHVNLLFLLAGTYARLGMKEQALDALEKVVGMTWLPKVIAAPTTRDYYLLMTQLAALLQDGHTNVEMPPELARAVYARPPLRTALVEDKVLVRHVGDEDVARRVRADDEIVAIGDT